MRLILSGGGTAGHVLPHIAVVKQLKKKVPNLEILYIGSRKGPERGFAEEWGIRFKSVPVGKWRRYWDWRNFVDPIKVALGTLKSLLIMLWWRPTVIFSKGGYVSLPVILAGWILRRPIVIHDSDSLPGLTTKIAAKFAKKICLGYEEAARFFHEKKVEITGTPIREEMMNGDQKKGLDLTGFNAQEPVVLVMGGSLGAQKVNEVVWEALPKLKKLCQVVHLTGKGKGRKRAKKSQKEASAGVPSEAKGHIGQYKAMEYAGPELAHLYAIADLIVSRAGANSLIEIQALKKPSILIPLGKDTSHGDQIENARILEKRGGAVVISDRKLNGAILAKTVKALLKDERELKRMGRRAENINNEHSAAKITKILRKL